MILLLGLIAADEEAVERAAGVVGMVGGATVPAMGVHHDDVTGLAEDDGFVGVGGGGKLAGEMGAGDGAGGAVEGGEVVEHPDGVEDGGAFFVGE